MQTVSYEDVKQCLRLIRNDCSTGHNKMPAMFIKPVVEFLVSPLTFTINNYIATKNFPDAWKTARIRPIPKRTQPVELKVIDLFQFCQFCKRFMKNLFHNNSQFLSRGNQFTINTNQAVKKSLRSNIIIKTAR